ncbi:hypothetical protein Tco_1182509 [Tanacetum coccineum]
MTSLEFCDKHNIVNWEYILLGMTEAKDSEVCKITRADGSSSFHGDFQALLRRLDRQDLFQLYSLVQERFKHHPLEGHDLDLWGDLRMIFDPNEEDDIWLNQQYWELLRWKLHEYSGVHSLFLDGTSIQINMLVEKKYPLKKEILEKMINLKIEAEEESSMAHELIKFIKSQIAEQNLKVNHKFRGGLLGIKELLQDNAAEHLVLLVVDLIYLSQQKIHSIGTYKNGEEVIKKDKEEEVVVKEKEDVEIENEKNDDVNVEKTDEGVKEKDVIDESGSQEIRKEQKQTPIPSPTRSLRNVSSSEKTDSEELTVVVSPTTATTSKTSSLSKRKKKSFLQKTKTLPGSIAGMCRR